ncbi:DUF4625 domain-containing protein [Chitinophaga rhizophila]|uniref:DUF4625 domain-containing protein n=1 Tax=Chitinophaga rhizophila TaxID=2866212 RepID=A0ABS7GAF4_9BACT|nr:DUF4625 domain-containing protein [Chitinophaga rhizophila]MBW8684641.1 DUF4625 domain-containing protein [Chitinophaga rhizophila]
MKKNVYIASLLIASLAIVSGCKKDEKDEVDTEYPVIDITASTAFPKQCEEIRRGEKFVFRAHFSDNVALGSSSIDIHHNFDHHTHSTEVESCNMDQKKTPVTPFLLIKQFPIPAGQKTYDIQQEISVPADVDPGDYHFMIRLTDKEGWQTIKGLSIKIK